MAKVQLIQHESVAAGPDLGADGYSSIMIGSFNFNSLATAWSTPINVSGTLSNLLVDVLSNTNDQNKTITLRQNGSAGNQSVSVTAATTGIFEDTTNTDSVTANDYFDISSPQGAGSGFFTSRSASLLFAATSNTVVVVGLNPQVAFNANGVTYFWPPAGDATGGTAEATVQFTTRNAGTWKNLGVTITTNGRTTTNTIRSRVDTANGNQVLTITAGTTGIVSDTSNTDTLADGDLLAISLTTGTGGGTFLFHILKSEIESTNSKYETLCAETTEAMFEATTSYFPTASYVDETSSATANNDEFRIDGTCTNLRIKISTNGIAANSAITTMKNGSDTALTATITASTTGLFEDTSNSFTFVSGDDIDHKIVTGNPAGFGASMNINNIGMTIENTEGGGEPPAVTTAIMDIIGSGIIPFRR